MGDKALQEEMKQMAEGGPNEEEDTEDLGIIEDQESEEDLEEEDAKEEEGSTEEDEEDGEEDDEGEEGTSEEEDTEDVGSEGTSEDQQERYLKIIETLASKKEEEKVKPKPLADIYESDEFKGLVEVLDLDDNEAKVIAAFMKALQNNTQQRSVEQAMKDTPEVVGKYVKRQSALTKMKDDFYAANPQLEPVKQYVAQAANNVAANNADWGMQKVLDEAAKITYKALGIKKELAKKKAKPGKGKKPAFAKGTKGARNKAPKKSKLQNDMQAMLNLE